VASRDHPAPTRDRRCRLSRLRHRRQAELVLAAIGKRMQQLGLRLHPALAFGREIVLPRSAAALPNSANT
jgi:hypothetical protein